MQTVINISTNVVICIECGNKTILINPGEKKDLSAECFAELGTSTYIENTHWATTTPDTSKDIIQLCIKDWLLSVANWAPSPYMTNFELAVQKTQKYLDFTPTPIAYIPTAIGNTTNLNSIVIDTNGEIWFIDYQGQAVKIKWVQPSILWDATTSSRIDITNATTIAVNPDLSQRKVVTNGNQILVPWEFSVQEFSYIWPFNPTPTNVAVSFNLDNHSNWTYSFASWSINLPAIPTWYKYKFIGEASFTVANQTSRNAMTYLELYTKLNWWYNNAKCTININTNDRCVYDGQTVAINQDMIVWNNSFTTEVRVHRLSTAIATNLFWTWEPWVQSNIVGSIYIVKT